MYTWLNSLTFAKAEFTIEAATPLRLPPYKGSTFRGAFGNQFRRIVCINQKADCESCILAEKCSYRFVFETPNSLRIEWFSSPKLPHPFILEPPQTGREDFTAGEELTFHLILIGGAVDYLPYFIFVFDQIGRRSGIGKNRRENFGRYILKTVTDDFAGKKVIYKGEDGILRGRLTMKTGADLTTEFKKNDGETVTLTFITPARLKHNGRYMLLRYQSHFHAAAFLRNLYRRAVLLTAGHCTNRPPEYDIPDFPGIFVKESRLDWYDWQRYSSRQEKKQHCGGFIGQVILKGEISKYLPLLRVGEIMHAGSGTVFGLGKYALSEESF